MAALNTIAKDSEVYSGSGLNMCLISGLAANRSDGAAAAPLSRGIIEPIYAIIGFSVPNDPIMILQSKVLSGPRRALGISLNSY